MLSHTASYFISNYSYLFHQFIILTVNFLNDIVLIRRPLCVVMTINCIHIKISFQLWSIIMLMYPKYAITEPTIKISMKQRQAESLFLKVAGNPELLKWSFEMKPDPCAVILEDDPVSRKRLPHVVVGKYHIYSQSPYGPEEIVDIENPRITEYFTKKVRILSGSPDDIIDVKMFRCPCAIKVVEDAAASSSANHSRTSAVKGGKPLLDELVHLVYEFTDVFEGMVGVVKGVGTMVMSEIVESFPWLNRFKYIEVDPVKVVISMCIAESDGQYMYFTRGLGGLNSYFIFMKHTRDTVHDTFIVRAHLHYPEKFPTL